MKHGIPHVLMKISKFSREEVNRTFKVSLGGKIKETQVKELNTLLGTQVWHTTGPLQ